MSFYENQLFLEKKIEQNIKEAYNGWDKLRCYNLLKLMVKVNKNNKVLLYYINKFNDKKLEKYYRKWAKQHDDAWFTFMSIFKSPSLYISAIFLYLTWQLK